MVSPVNTHGLILLSDPMSNAVSNNDERHACEIIRQHAAAMEVQPTGVTPALRRLDGIRSVLFDVYGTLFISGSGDVGTIRVGSQPRAFPEALAAAGLRFDGDAAEGVRMLEETITAHHHRSRDAGITFPEVDIREVWSDVLKQLSQAGRLHIPDGASVPMEATSLALEFSLAVEYEVRTNPTWPMPSSLACLHRLRDAGLSLGIVSNAQCFTRLLFPTLMGQSPDELGFREDWCVWSYEHRQAKPGTYLFERAREAVEADGLAADEVLYVGNDRLKDVWPASLVGFRTALFAGDARSYRPRNEDERLTEVTPDLVLTELAQLSGCLGVD